MAKNSIKWLNNFLTLWLYYIYIIIKNKTVMLRVVLRTMGLYLKLTYNHALWIVFRKDWMLQNIRIERVRGEWLICLPAVQLIYT